MSEFLANPFVNYIVFDWPLYVVALLIAIFGIANSQWGLVLLSAVLIAPFTYVLNGTENFSGFALLLPIFHIASAIATKEDSETWAWALLAPTMIVKAWLLMVAVVSSMP